MAKKKEKRRSLLDKIRGLETETHPQGKRVGQLFQAIAAGEIEVSCVLLFLEILNVVYSGLTSAVWKSQSLADLRGGVRGGGVGVSKNLSVQYFFNVMPFLGKKMAKVIGLCPTFAVDPPPRMDPGLPIENVINPERGC